MFYRRVNEAVPHGVKVFLKCASGALMDFRNHDGMEYAGYLSFMVLLSMFPFLVFFNALTSSILGMVDKDQMLYAKLFDLLSDELPHDTMAALLPRIEEILSGPPHSLLTVAIVGVVWTASSVIEGIRNVLNRALRVSAPPPYILGRMFSILQFLIIVVIMILSALCVILVPLMFEAAGGRWALLRFSVTKLIIFISIAWVYFMVPNLKQKFVLVIPGAVVVTILWSLSSTAFSWYLSNSQLSSMYGNLTGVIAAMLFFYILSIFFIYGAELNYRLSSNRSFMNTDEMLIRANKI